MPASPYPAASQTICLQFTPEKAAAPVSPGLTPNRAPSGRCSRTHAHALPCPPTPVPALQGAGRGERGAGSPGTQEGRFPAKPQREHRAWLSGAAWLPPAPSRGRGELQVRPAKNLPG